MERPTPQMPPQGPCFATVSFVSEGVAHGPTFRVPINDMTSVRRLAKDALARLQLHERSNGHDIPSSDLAIREVYVGDHAAQLFVHDVVVQVVSVKEERIYLVLRETEKKEVPPPEPVSAHDANHKPNPPSKPLPATKHVVRSPSPTVSSIAAGPVSFKHHHLAERSRSPDRSGLVLNVTSCSPRSTRGPAWNTTPMPPPQVVTDMSPKGLRTEVLATPPNNVASAHQTSKRAPDIPATEKHRVSKTEKKTLEARLATSPVRKHHRRETGSTPEENKIKTLEDMTAEEREAFVAQKMKEGWGPQSFGKYESNYVSDPDKLARQLRKHKQQAKANSHNAAPPRKLVVDADAETQAAPAPMLARPLFLADHLLIVEPSSSFVSLSPQQPLPEGWGCDAAKYFDPRTYHANPAKAKIDESLLREPVRPRRHQCN